METYKKFSSHRPESMKKGDSPFYLAIKYAREDDDQIWYKNAPLGKNTISQFLKNACQRAGIQGRKTNHSARKTCVKRALEAGCSREYVAQLTGHKSVTSLENYAEADVPVQKAMCTSVMCGEPFRIASGTSSTSSSSSTSTVTETQTVMPGTTVVFNITNCGTVNINTK